MKVYIVTSGEYSDYGIEQVYSNNEQAELHARLKDGRVEEYELLDVYEPEDDEDKVILERALKGDYPYSMKVSINQDGSVSAYVEPYNDCGYDEFNIMKPFRFSWGRQITWSGEIFAKDKSHAQKVLDDYVIQIKAMGYEHWDKIKEVK